MPDATPSTSWLPRIAGAVGAALALVGFLALVLFFPEPADYLFDQGGKAPLLLGLVGVGAMAGAYWGCERLASRLTRRG